jgi:glycosyltransferase involved in cell wall biosynthesis
VGDALDPGRFTDDVLFVSHDASRTGSPIVLLTFLRWIREEHGLTPRVACLRGGPLVPAFRALGPTRVLAPFGRWSPGEVVEIGLDRLGFRGASAVGSRARSALRAFGLPSPELVWINSVASAPALRLPGLRRSRVIAAVHEIDTTLGGALDPGDRERLAARADRLVAGAPAIARALVDEGGVPPERVVVGAEFIDPDRSPDGRRRGDGGDRRAELRRSCGVPDGAVVVGGCGGLSHRKGPDLFVRTAAALRDRDDIVFVWVGGPVHGPQWNALAHDVERAGIRSRVRFVGPVDDIGPYVGMFDIFVSTARRDGLPLSALEAAHAGRPIVGFDSSALGDLVTDENEPCGALVPLYDTERLAREIASLVDDPARRHRWGARARARARSGHTVAAGAPIWFDQLREAVRSEARAT